MTEVISVKFKGRGKSYFFDPNGKKVRSGEQVIVETSKGLEIADCTMGNHEVDDNAVVQPLRPVVRIATADDLRVAELNKTREKEAFEICRRKIEEHGLDMKLVDVECNFDGSKTMFFFTADGRVDFRELVKDLAGIFRNRIELRQIGVRDEAKMLGGLGICGRPFCCSKFLDDFQPVSTKMAKVQSMSLNPTKISGTCGRLMCCLRYEQEAYEDLTGKVPKQGAFVETPEGYGTVMQVNLLRQLVKVKLDGDGDDTVKTYRSVEIAAVPGGRPKDGEAPPSVLKYVPEPEEEEPEENGWSFPDVVVNSEPEELPEEKPREQQPRKPAGGSHRKRGPHYKKPAQTAEKKQTEQAVPAEKAPAAEARTVKAKPRRSSGHSKSKSESVKAQTAKPENAAQPAEKKKPAGKRHYYYHHNKPKQGGKSSGGK